MGWKEWAEKRRTWPETGWMGISQVLLEREAVWSTQTSADQTVHKKINIYHRSKSGLCQLLLSYRSFPWCLCLSYHSLFLSCSFMCLLNSPENVIFSLLMATSLFSSISYRLLSVWRPDWLELWFSFFSSSCCPRESLSKRNMKVQGSKRGMIEISLSPSGPFETLLFFSFLSPCLSLSLLLVETRISPHKIHWTSGAAVVLEILLIAVFSSQKYQMNFWWEDRKKRHQVSQIKRQEIRRQSGFQNLWDRGKQREIFQNPGYKKIGEKRRRDILWGRQTEQRDFLQDSTLLFHHQTDDSKSPHDWEDCLLQTFAP